MLEDRDTLGALENSLRKVSGLIPYTNRLVVEKVKEGINLFFSTLSAEFRKMVGEDIDLSEGAIKVFPTTPYPQLFGGILGVLWYWGTDKDVEFNNPNPGCYLNLGSNLALEAG